MVSFAHNLFMVRKSENDHVAYTYVDGGMLVRETCFSGYYEISGLNSKKARYRGRPSVPSSRNGGNKSVDKYEKRFDINLMNRIIASTG